MICILPIKSGDLLRGGEGVWKLGHVADEIDDWLNIVIPEKVMSRCHLG
jgi:hypothetical protein